MKYAIYHGNENGRVALKKFQWTTTPPTEPGVYQVAHAPFCEPEHVKVWKSCVDGGLHVETFGHETRPLEAFSHWLGPIPLAERPTE